MAIALRHVDHFLRGTGRFFPAAVTPRPWWWLPLIVVCFGPIYGGFMGSYHFVSPDRIWQIVFSGVKIARLDELAGLFDIGAGRRFVVAIVHAALFGLPGSLFGRFDISQGVSSYRS